MSLLVLVGAAQFYIAQHAGQVPKGNSSELVGETDEAEDEWLEFRVKISHFWMKSMLKYSWN